PSISIDAGDRVPHALGVPWLVGSGGGKGKARLVDQTTPAGSRVAFGLMGGLAAPRLSILIFHRVFAAVDPLFPDQVDSMQFDRLLRSIGRTFRVMTLGQALT